MTTMLRLVLMLLLIATQVESFAPTRWSPGRFAVQLHSGEVTEGEVGEMTDLIISISLEPTDESRRERVVKLFEEELSKPNGGPAKFAALFDQVLMVVGDKIQADARKRVMEAGQQTAEEAEEEAKKKDFMDRPTQERQLWALVDLMVQSKMLVKKFDGSLGNGGTFN